MEYYAIPLRIDQIIKGKHLDSQIELRKAIHENVNLILKTFTMSYRFDSSFGCVMNKYHASTPPQGKSERIWREKMRESIQRNLKDMLQRYETRIKVKDVIIGMQQPKNQRDKAIVKVKVEIVGELAIGRREKFHFPDSEVSEDAKGVFPLMIPVGKVKR